MEDAALTSTPQRRNAARPRLPLATGGDDPVERAAAEIREVTRTAALDLALNIGEIVFRLIFRNDAEAFRSRGRKDMPFRRLAKRSDLSISAAQLYRCTAIYELSLRAPVIKRSCHLKLVHVRAVLGLSPQHQEDLLVRADRERWEAKILQSKAVAQQKGHGGRRPKPQIVRILDSLRRIASLPVSTFEDARRIRAQGEDEIDVALETLREIEVRCNAMRHAIAELRSGVT